MNKENMNKEKTKTEMMDKETIKRILKERAIKLAEKPKTEDEYYSSISVLVFALADEKYGVELDFIKEVIPLKELTILPQAPEYVMGITNVRGKITSIIDLKKFFNLPEKGITNLNKVIILKHGEMEFGILADNILGIEDIMEKDLQTDISTFKGLLKDYLRGVTKERIIVINAEFLLTDRNLVVNELF
jgi:purine-binding chemotaxis protein CheW